MRLSSLLKVALLASLATLLMNLQIPMFQPWLLYDPSEVPALVGGFAIAPIAGMAIVLLKNLLFLATHFQPTELVGMPMNTIAGLTYVGVACAIYHQRKTKRMAKISLVLGVVAMALVMIPANLLVLPIFQRWFAPAQVASKSEILLGTMLIVILFNLCKGAITGILTFFTYKRFSRILKSEQLWDD